MSSEYSSPRYFDERDQALGLRLLGNALIKQQKKAPREQGMQLLMG